MALPNVLLAHCHDLGTYLGCYGRDVDTPAIDDLAAGGARFDRHFVTAPQCSTSRGSLMTGLHPHENGLIGLAHGDWEIHPDLRVLPEYFSAAGYETHLFGLQHVTERPARLGYDRVHPEELLTTDSPPTVHQDARAREVSEEVASVLGEDRDRPIFASVGFFEAHRVEEEDGFGFDADSGRYDVPDPDDVEPLPFLPDEPGIREDVAGLQGMVRAIDDGVGRIRSALEEAGLAKETLLVFTTEHGLAMPRAKGCCFEAGIRSALLVSRPGVVSPQVRRELVSNVDVFATLLEAAGISPDGEVSGRSFAPLLGLAERNYEPREQVFAGMTWHDRYNPMRAIRTDRWKYVRNFWHLPAVYMTTDIYASPAGRACHEEFYGEQRAYEELYDVENDPFEEENLADEDGYEGVRKHLHGDLLEWMHETDDPLLSGPVVPDDWEEIHPELGADLVDGR